MGKWTDAGNSWTYSPFLKGDDDPNKPPPGVEYKDGPPYKCDRDGKTYKTYLVKMEVKESKSMLSMLLGIKKDSGKTTSIVWQQIVDWSQEIK